MLATLRNWHRSTFGHALAGAVALWAALPPLDLWPLAWVAPVWWVLLIRRAELPGRKPYRALCLVGFLFWLAAVHWLRLPHWLTGFGWLALAFYLSFYLPVFVGLARVAVHRLRVPVIVAAPVVWTGLELARGHLLGGFTMASLGHTQYRWIGLIQLSDLAGAYGVGFVVMFVAACMGRMVRCDRKPTAYWPLAPLLGVLAAALVYGHARISELPTRPKTRIALIQGSIDTQLNPEPNTRVRMHEQYYQLSRKAVEDYGQLDLIVWPETAFGGQLITYEEGCQIPDWWRGSEADFRSGLEKGASDNRRAIKELAEELKTPLLLGITRRHFGRGAQQVFNSAVYVTRSGELWGQYDKVHLVLFGEYFPLAEYLSWVYDFTPVNTLHMGLDAGNKPAALELGHLCLAPNICYESVIPHVIRGQVNTLAHQGREPDVLVNLTNDGWFWGSSELDMHLVCGVFRAVECRKPFLIAANTGFSAWIDADGRIVRQGPRRKTGTILAEVGPDPRSSWYLKHGDWAAGLCLSASLVLAAVGGWDRWKRRRAGRESSTAGGKS